MRKMWDLGGIVHKIGYNQLLLLSIVLLVFFLIILCDKKVANRYIRVLAGKGVLGNPRINSFSAIMQTKTWIQSKCI